MLEIELSLKVTYKVMPQAKPHNARKFIYPLNMNKLRGRMLIVPKAKSNSKTEFLIVYGQNSTLEKWYGLANELRKYGNVTMPDLPGFGGMQSFYKLYDKPSIDNYADYLAAFIKLRYRRKKIVIVGLSFGFVVATRMLQKYPELTSRVHLLINVSGLTHKDDLKQSSLKRKTNLIITKILTKNVTAGIYNAFAHDEFIYKIFHKIPYDNYLIDKKQYTKIIRYEINIQKKSDTKTKMYVMNEILQLDNCKQTINLPVWSIVGAYDEYIKPDSVRNHLEGIFSKYHEISFKKNSHKGFMGAVETEEVANIIPYKLKVLLNRYNKQTK